MVKIKNIETLEHYEFLLEEKCEIKKQSLAINAKLLKKSLNPFSLISDKITESFTLESNQEVKIYTAVELINWIYKLVSKTKETPSIIRLLRMYLPKYFAFKDSFNDKPCPRTPWDE